MSLLIYLLVFCVMNYIISASSHDCDRHLSRKLTEYFKNMIYPKLSFDATALPSKCPLNPNYNIFVNQELNKEQENRARWKCGYCNKKFKNEFYLDRHIDLKHNDTLNLHDYSGCVSDLCPIFGCSHEDFSSVASSSSSGSGMQACITKAERMKFRCEKMVRDCFNQISGDNGHLVADFRSMICDSLTCDSENSKLKGIFDLWDRKNNYGDNNVEDNDTRINVTHVFVWTIVFLLIMGACFFLLFSRSKYGQNKKKSFDMTPRFFKDKNY